MKENGIFILSLVGHWTRRFPMPIKPENKPRYPSNWKEISKKVRSEAGQCCEWCSARNGTWISRKISNPGRFVYSRKGFMGDRAWRRAIRVVLTVAHMNHTPEDCRLENLRALCQRCHLSYDVRSAVRARQRTTKTIERQRAAQRSRSRSRRESSNRVFQIDEQLTLF